MDENKKLTEGLLKADGIDPEAVTDSERIAFGDMLDRQLNIKRSKPGFMRPDIWRIIMRNRMTKFAAAAIVVVGVFIGMEYFSGDGVAWGEVIEQIRSRTKYKCRQRVVRENGAEFPTMDVYHLNLSLRRQEVENGDIHIIDMRGSDAITVELKTSEKKAIVTTLVGFGPRKDPDIIEKVRRFEKEPDEKLGTKKKGGKVLYGFRHQPNKYNVYTIWVDEDTKLPVEIELLHPTAGQTIFMDEFEFDFDLGESAFSTEVPDGYEVKRITRDYREVESKEIDAKDIRAGLNHTAHTVENLAWAQKVVILQAVDPLMKRGKVYMTGIVSDDGNLIIIDQSNTHSDYKEAFMEWIVKEELVLEISGGVRLYTHPNGAEYARLYLEGFANASAGIFDVKDLSEERFTRMIVMGDGTIMGLSANKQMPDEKLQELVESLVEIKGD